MEKQKKKESKYYCGLGRRKSAVARVRIYEGGKSFQLNGKEKEINPDFSKPFELVGKKGSFSISVLVSGGGWAGQKDAIVLGIARSLVAYNKDFRGALKKAGFLKRDPREVERKKPGLKKARRAPQWAKR